MDAKSWMLSKHLHNAMSERDYKAIDNILDSGFDIDTYIMCHKPAISIAIENRWLDVARHLIYRGCSLSLKTENGRTPLLLAVLAKDHPLVTLLLENRADVISVDFHGKTALHYAAEMDLLAISNLLLSYATKKCLVNLRDRDGKTPLMYACSYGRVDLISTLLSHGADVQVCDVNGNTPLLYALSNLNLSAAMIQVLLDAGSDINHRNNMGETSLLIAITEYSYHHPRNTEPYKSVCSLLIERGSDVSAKNILNETPLHIAVHTLKDEALIQKLLNYGSEVNVMDGIGCVPLLYACKQRNTSVISLLLSAGAHLRDYGVTAKGQDHWLLASFNFDERTCSLLLEVIKQCQSVPSLKGMCRTVVRRAFSRNVEKKVLQSHLPLTLKNYLLLGE